MNKLMTVAAASVCAVSLSVPAFANEESSTDDTKAETRAREEGEALEEEKTPFYEAGVDLDFFTAYIDRNVIQTDKPVFQPCVWADLTALDPFWFGFSYWQNWDLSSDRSDTFRRRLNESDYNVHAGATPWESESGEMSVDLEIGHEWYTYHFDRDRSAPSTREFYVKGAFENPFIGVYGRIHWMYDDVSDYDRGFYYDFGFKKEFELNDTLTLGADWNVSLADDHYTEFYIDDVGGGFMGTTVKTYLSWSVTEWMSIVGTIAYTGILNHDARGYYNDEDKDKKDLLWGGVSAKFTF